MTFAVGCRRLTLPDGWKPVEDPMYETALRQTARAFASAAKNLKRYYDPEGGYSGATFLGVPSGDDGAVTAADLWAVSTLSMKVPPQHGRELLPGGSLADVVTSKLRSLPTDLDLPDATPDHLRTMGELQDAVRKAFRRWESAPTPTSGSSRPSCAPARGRGCSRSATRRCARTSPATGGGERRPGSSGGSPATSRCSPASSRIPTYAHGWRRPAPDLRPRIRTGPLITRSCGCSTSSCGWRRLTGRETHHGSLYQGDPPTRPMETRLVLLHQPRRPGRFFLLARFLHSRCRMRLAVARLHVPACLRAAVGTTAALLRHRNHLPPGAIDLHDRAGWSEDPLAVQKSRARPGSHGSRTLQGSGPVAGVSCSRRWSRSPRTRSSCRPAASSCRR